MRRLFCPALVFFAGGLTLLAFVIYGAKFTDYDDFSHWATVLRVILRENRFPNFEEAGLIYFPSYPPGTAAFIYFFEKSAGLNFEWSQMFFQAALTLAMTLPLFAYAKSVLGNIAAGAISLILCAGLMTDRRMFNTLLVDKSLALTGLAALLITVYYRDSLSKVRAVCPLFTAFLISIKNSGIFFILPPLFCYWYFTRERRRHAGEIIFQAAVPAVTLSVWQGHVKIVFSGGMNGKHSLSPGYMAGVFSGKTPDDVKNVIVLMLKRTFSPGNMSLYLIPLAVVACLLLVLRREKGTGVRSGIKTALKPLLFGAAVYLAYCAGLLGMYLFSMPTNEALALAAYDRYHGTILLYLAGAAAVPVLPMITFSRKTRARNVIAAGLALLSVSTALFTVRPTLKAYITPERANPDMEKGRAEYERIIAEERIPEGSSCLLISDWCDTGYLWFMTRYLLYSGDSWAQGSDYTPEETNKTVVETFRHYDYVFLIYPSEETRAWFRETFDVDGDLVRVADLPEDFSPVV